MPAHSPGVGKNHVGKGAERPGDQPAGVEEKNRLNVLTAALFFFTYFAQGSDFLLGGECSPWVPAHSAALFTLGAQSSFPLCVSPSLLVRRCRGVPGKENAVHLNFK